jgi:hypothetical protein
MVVLGRWAVPSERGTPVACGVLLPTPAGNARGFHILNLRERHILSRSKSLLLQSVLLQMTNLETL